MVSSTIVSAGTVPPKSGSVVAPEKEQAEAEAGVETPVQEPALSKRRRDKTYKQKLKRKMRETAMCVGYYIDALDKKMLWGEARIIRCNLTSKKIKVHFVGWSRNHDLWTDAKSITAHGRYAPRTKDRTVKSWNGDMHLFEDMLGEIDEATFTPAAVPLHKKRSALLPTSAKKKAGEIKKTPSATRALQTERLTLKRKAEVREKAITKRIAATSKVVERNRHQRQRLKHAGAAKESMKEKRKSPQSFKWQKREVQQSSALTTVNGRPSTKYRDVSPNNIPLFRNLELDDGTVLDFSVQREKARKERDAMRSFLDKCSLVWKNQLIALSVQN